MTPHHPLFETPLRRRFEEHERRVPERAPLLRHSPTHPDCYADTVTQARWEFWQAAQPGPLSLASARLYLNSLQRRATFSKDRTAILRAAQHLMRCIRNDNPELF